MEEKPIYKAKSEADVRGDQYRKRAIALSRSNGFYRKENRILKRTLQAYCQATDQELEHSYRTMRAQNIMIFIGATLFMACMAATAVDYVVR